MAAFELGQIVCLRADPAVSGAVIQVFPGEPEDRYVLYHDGRRVTYYATQLQAIAEAAGATVPIPLPEFQARLTALQLLQPSLSTLYSLHAARVQFVPYQFRPVLKFMRADRPRLLIADEVGVGKTIEAGLILRELQARRDVASVLIICPRPLVTERKWELEMQRFDEQFVPLDGPTLRHCLSETDLNGVWPERYARCILPFSLFDERLLFGGDRRGGSGALGLLGLDPPPRFDLVIVDEAHHLRNTATYLHQGARFFCEHAEAALFLTATPIQLQSEDLFVLLQLLRPDVILDRQAFEQMSGPNPFLNAAVECARAARVGWERETAADLHRAGETEWGRAVLRRNPIYTRVRDRLAYAELPPPERLALIRDMESLHTFAHLINRMRRRDIGSFTTRKANSIEVPFTLTQQRLHDALLAAQVRILRRRHGDRQVMFMMTTLRRQAASCLYGLAPFIRDILSRHVDDLQWDEADENSEPIGEQAIAPLAEEIQDVLAMAERLEPSDPKLDALRRIVHDKQGLPNNKVLLFSSFLHTLRYLHDELGRGFVRVGLIHGSTPDDVRWALRDRFRRPPEDPTAIDLLLSSEVGCEGLDYQFCDCLVNYDLPWNPMRIEQRIGRIDRYGQKSPIVAIYNFITPGTVDADIYSRCHLRIGLFQQALGGSEEVLGRLTRELRTIAENLDLTEEEREARLQQLSDNEIRLLQEQAALEERQVELFGIVLPRQQLEQDITDASSAWLTPSALRNLVWHYLTARAGAETPILGEGAVQALRLSQEARTRVLADYQQLPRQASSVHRTWELWLKGMEPRLEITFDAETASERRDVALINPIHPLAQQAAGLLGTEAGFRTVCAVRDATVTPGIYPFALYQWRRVGIRSDTILVPICEEDALTDRVLALLEQAVPVAAERYELASHLVLDRLEEHHYRRWSEARADHREETGRTAHYRRESLRASHAARLALLREQQAQTDNDRIRRMRASQLAAAEEDFERRLAAIDAAEQKADIISEAVGSGVLVVEGAK